tara:strand:- start:23 stop:505 length:483 start_codon:yes stop_codon:yes gene_type:complete
MAEGENRNTPIIIETKSSSTSLSTVLLWLVAVAIGVVIGCVFAPNIPFVGNKVINKLENDNKELRITIENRNKNIIILEQKNDTLNGMYETLQVVVSDRDSVIREITYEIDSINTMVITQDSIINKIYDERYKDINNVADMDVNERISFFTDYFRARLRP